MKRGHPRRFQQEPLRRVNAVYALREAAQDQTSIVAPDGRSISPHGRYRYPARFSPRFAAAAIELVSQPNDLILDPFVGSGTTLIEAMRHGRRCVGIDISPISWFLTQSALTVQCQASLESFVPWVTRRSNRLVKSQNFRTLSDDFPCDHIDLRRHWRLVRLIDTLLIDATLHSKEYDQLMRQVLLRSAQWAFDNRSEPPTFRELVKFTQRTAIDIVIASRAFSENVREKWGEGRSEHDHRVFMGAASSLLSENEHLSTLKFDAVVTSPPYPGVHMLYGRWQIGGRRETDMPLWIVGAESVLREGDYTMHARREFDNSTYFKILHETMASCRGHLRDGAWMIQLVGFNNPNVQLPKYLKCVQSAGFRETSSLRLATRSDGRLWRSVPRRKWYANGAGNSLRTKNEVVLLFRAV